MAPSPHYRVQLLQAWRLTDRGQPIVLNSREQRVVALLALHGGRPRSYLAGLLWPDSTEARAAGSLRAAVCRLERAAPGLVVSHAGQLALDPEVGVDVAEFIAVAEALTVLIDDPSPDPAAERDAAGARQCLLMLSTGDLLPGWYDDWLIDERFRLQQLRLGALEGLAEILADRGQLTAALSAAMTAARLEPLRESAQRAVIRLHLANGNYHDAIREYRTFGRRLVRELGVRPSVQMDALVRPLLARQAQANPAASTATRTPTARPNQAIPSRWNRLQSVATPTNQKKVANL